MTDTTFAILVSIASFIATVSAAWAVMRLRVSSLRQQLSGFSARINRELDTLKAREQRMRDALTVLLTPYDLDERPGYTRARQSYARTLLGKD